MDIRNLHTQELEDFLYSYTIALHNFNEINAPYSELIEQASADYEKYYQKKINDFEEWKQSKKSQNLYDVKNNKIPVLEKKRDSLQKLPSVLLGILGFIIGFILNVLLIAIFSISSLVSLILLVLCIIFSYNINKIKKVYYNIKIENIKKAAIQKDEENESSEVTLKNEYQLEEQLNTIDDIYNDFIEELEESFKQDTASIVSYLDELESSIPENYQDNIELASNLYIYVYDGRANNWKEAINLFHEDQKHNELLNSIEALSEVIESGFNRISYNQYETNNNIKQMSNQVETANQNIEKLNENFNDITNEVINLNKESLNELKQMNPKNKYN
ncbi:hypothetical protein [Staphylococcus caeli]|uniref:Uncharacterized protein n=1 Tax=Staphylococcus caeli TaxID=2201815 RepID=A0A1D4R624_9STAP|nr:hypothetical protein [Staphylococcus caeli]SCT42901.1 Uncharacterised protein [Staphylococcus caeli]SCT46254.1 Uncharacterised protein [Staphylococcus caeli]